MTNKSISEQCGHIKRKLKLNEYEYHIMIDVLLLHKKLGA